MNETRLQRSRTMRAVKSENTGPEMTIKRLAHRMGYRYRLHRKDLPGKPDLVFGPRKKLSSFMDAFGTATNARAVIELQRVIAHIG